MEEVVPAKSSWSGIVKKGQRLKIIDLEGQQAVDFLCYNNNDRSDRYSATNTVKVQENVYVGLGSILYSDSGTPLLEVVEDMTDSFRTNLRQGLRLCADEFVLHVCLQ